MNTTVMFSALRPDWETPWSLFNALHDRYRFTMDTCATAENTKLPRFFSIEKNGLTQSWSEERCWCNPPYGKGIVDWVRKANEETCNGCPLVVMLLPARTDTRWFHTYILPYRRVQIQFLRGRVKFCGAKASAPFPSMLCIFSREI